MKMIKLRKKPVKPVREYFPQDISLYDGSTLLDVLEAVKMYSLDPATVKFRVEHGYYDSVNYSFQYQMLEPEEVYNRKLQWYEVKLAEYEKWYEKNKILIDKELARQEEVEVVKLLEDKVKTKIALQKELSRIQKQLEKML
jgi:hypothetical protein